MAIALIVLAIGSVAAGYVGVPHVLGGENRIEAYLEPSFEAHAAGAAMEGAAAPAEAPAAEHAAAPVGEAAHDNAMEMPLMIFSVLIAGAGILTATYFFKWKPQAADGVAASLSGVHTVLLNKYYVDEFYNAAIVQPIKMVSTGVLWRGVDAGLIDGTVNAVGLVVRGWSAVLRRLQTGSVRAYAMSLFVGVVVIVGYYLSAWVR